jgi:glycosyltransferase involved in cell wall biosynthesis
MVKSGCRVRVSVCVVTYNQEKYIRQCLQSIVEQEVDFEFEIIVGDDYSTDSTRTIVQEFADKYPSLFRTIFQEKNTGFTKNMYDVYKSARGELIAHIDGDDVMLSGKLKCQVRFLDEHQDCSIVAHDVQVIDDASLVVRESWVGSESPAEFTNLSGLVETGCFFPHSSKMFRKKAVRSRYVGKPVVDFYHHIEHAQSGLIGYLNEPLGQYRKTSSGISSINSQHRLSVMSSYLDGYNLALDAGVKVDVVRRARISFRYINAMASIRAGDIVGFQFISNFDKEDIDFLGARERFVKGAARWPLILRCLVNGFDFVIKQLVNIRQQK